MTADRTAIVLVEDLLALNNSSSGNAGVLDASRIDDLRATISDPAKYYKLRTDLGLNMSGDALYSLEVIIEDDNGNTIDMMNSDDAAITLIGNIGQSKRFIFIRDPDGTGTDNYPGHMAILTVRLW
jgi:hypothetical protein